MKSAEAASGPLGESGQLGEDCRCRPTEANTITGNPGPSSVSTSPRHVTSTRSADTANMFAGRAFARTRLAARLPRQPPAKQPLRQTSTNTNRTAEKILDRVPSRFQKYTSGLRKAPLSHIVAFLILHEITAIVPLLGLFGLFHYTNFLPLEYVTGHWAGYVRDGVGKAERYFSRKGWFGFGAEDRGTMTGELDATGCESEEVERKWSKEEGAVTGSVRHTSARPTDETAKNTQDLLEKWQQDGKYEVVVEVAIAWGITKALLPARILVSVWGTPWFAGVMGRARGLFRSSR
ncbi:Uncharacterized protein Cob_v007646 [Colletotrichum orbiculare MAFF 240422]|uniref:Uncharacterized protein n=1 Tax=Colletotrichum orbiculare (strain 104-T / ATCC 96160 / CBS 514.97 / LARS 414 / MAFF 240422) TaxID=1213857 RepID=N4V398_COLOR|nr:Uncharacterized protein Cob_v007646 [Colletotrichum orbiculare MAFF 240422]